MLIKMRDVTLNFFNRLRAWFVSIGDSNKVNISLFNKTTTIIICKAIEGLPNERVRSRVKKEIEFAMTEAGIEKQFNSFIKDKIE